MGAKKKADSAWGDGNFLNVILASNDSVPMSEEETGDLGPGSGLWNRYILTTAILAKWQRHFGSSKTFSSLISKVFLSFLDICPKYVFLDKPKIAFFAFKIHTGEYILCSFGLCVWKLHFHLNLKWHCLHLKGISDHLKPHVNLLLSSLYVCTKLC